MSRSPPRWRRTPGRREPARTGSGSPAATSDGEPGEAYALGRTCALAAECGRDLRRCAQMYGVLFPPAAFDAALYNTLTLGTAFSAPWATADRLKVVNRASLWVLAVDRLVDHTATTREQVNRLTRECLSVAEGAVPRSAVTRFLADLRDERATVKEFDGLRWLWRDQLTRMLAGMAQAWVWRDTHAGPTLDRYLDNADSRGSCFVDLSHWIYTGDDWTKAHLNNYAPSAGMHSAICICSVTWRRIGET
ncbi:hypothetical protein ETD86_20765 [Nonomuraea turkmeniaca]|uniref:Terpene synthase n=1 Tax=Nonomuraea turkmeniaca TaxID=103838 RepID=A0A5S4FGS1_9ACTN|nr:hypothetical protein [Nonomuraea turkmeniaca]TMR19072.1 hypothetical protein ETD86_20765 [Nonomuraea turkmeniaca]